MRASQIAVSVETLAESFATLQVWHQPQDVTSRTQFKKALGADLPVRAQLAFGKNSYFVVLSAASLAFLAW
jgi:hypothetical protein